MPSPEDTRGQRGGVVSPASAGPKHVGEEISRLRRERNLTQEELADRIPGLSRHYLGVIEKSHAPGRKYFSALEKFFGLDSGTLIKIHAEWTKREPREQTKYLRIAKFLALIEEKIGKPVANIEKTKVKDKFLAITGDGSVYEIVVTIKQVYEP